MSINSINGYKSAYGKEALQAKTQYNPALNNAGQGDSYNSKYKKNKSDSSIISTIALVGVGLFAGYKGKNQIKKVLDNCGKGAQAFKERCPEAGKSLKNACKEVVKSLGMFFKKA